MQAGAVLSSDLASQRRQPQPAPVHVCASCSAILAHPFLTELADGSLDEASFKFYIVQGALYLRWDSLPGRPHALFY